MTFHLQLPQNWNSMIFNWSIAFSYSTCRTISVCISVISFFVCLDGQAGQFLFWLTKRLISQLFKNRENYNGNKQQFKKNRYCIARVPLVYLAEKCQKEGETAVVKKKKKSLVALIGPPDFQYWQPMTDSTQQYTQLFFFTSQLNILASSAHTNTIACRFHVHISQRNTTPHHTVQYSTA